MSTLLCTPYIPKNENGKGVRKAGRQADKADCSPSTGELGRENPRGSRARDLKLPLGRSFPSVGRLFPGSLAFHRLWEHYITLGSTRRERNRKEKKNRKAGADVTL